MKLNEIKPLTEANVYASRYKVGDEVMYQPQKKTIPKATKGDIFTKVDPKKANRFKTVDLSSGKGATETVFLKSDKMSIKLIGSANLINGMFRKPAKVSSSGKKEVSATQWETMIVVGWNKINKINIKNKKKLLSAAKIDDSQFKANDKIATKIAKNLKDLPQEEMIHFGSGSGKLNPKWKGKNSTPKTDMYMSGKKVRLSLKKAGGSQLMSGVKEEAVSTFYAAIDSLTKESQKEAKRLVKLMEKTFTKYESSMTGAEIRRIIKATPNKNDIPAELLEFLKKSEAHTKLQTKLRDFFSKEPEFAKWIVFEAMTGKQKFNDKISDATHICKFSPTTGTASLIKITPTYAARISKQIDVQVNFKTAGGSSTKATALRVRDLSEGEHLTEGAMLDFVKRMLKKLIKWLVETFGKSVQKGLELLGLEPTVSITGADKVEF